MISTVAIIYGWLSAKKEMFNLVNSTLLANLHALGWKYSQWKKPGLCCANLNRGCKRTVDHLDDWYKKPQQCLCALAHDSPWGLSENVSMLETLPSFPGNLCDMRDKGPLIDPGQVGPRFKVIHQKSLATITYLNWDSRSGTGSYPHKKGTKGTKIRISHPLLVYIKLLRGKGPSLFPLSLTQPANLIIRAVAPPSGTWTTRCRCLARKHMQTGLELTQRKPLTMHIAGSLESQPGMLHP